MASLVVTRRIPKLRKLIYTAAMMLAALAAATIASVLPASTAQAAGMHRAAPTSITFTGECAAATPALAQMYVGNVNYFFIAWIGCDSGHHLNVEASTNASNWGNCNSYVCTKWTLNQESLSGQGAALAAWNGHLYVAWVGTDTHLNLGEYNWSSTLLNKVTLADTSPFTPSIATYLSYGTYKLYLCWAGTDSAHHLSYEYTTDGVNFTGKVVGSDTTAAGPSIHEWSDSPAGDVLYVAWRGTDSLNRVNVAYYQGTSSLGNKVTLKDCAASGCNAVGTSGDVGLAVGGDSKLYLSFFSSDLVTATSDVPSDAIMLADSADGTNYTYGVSGYNITLPYTYGPSVAYFAGEVWQAWTTNSHWYVNGSVYTG